MAIHRGPWGPYQDEADAYSQGYGADEMDIVAQRSHETRQRHPAAKGWQLAPIIPSAVPEPSVPTRAVDEQWEFPGCIAIQAIGLQNSTIVGATFLLVTLRSMRQSALITRQVRVYRWGMAFPWAAGQCQIDVQVGPTSFAGPSPPPVVISAAISRGVPVPEEMPEPDVVLAGVPVPIQPVDFARWLRLTVLAGGPLVTPIPLAAGQSAKMAAFPRTLTGPAGTIVSVEWGVLSP